MGREVGRQRERMGTRPLARAIDRFMQENGLTAYDDLAKIAYNEKGVSVSGETFRKAATDGYKRPMDEASIAKVAAGLRMSPDEVRALDMAAWYPSAVPVGYNVDPALLSKLADASPDEVRRVSDFLDGIRAR